MIKFLSLIADGRFEADIAMDQFYKPLTLEGMQATRDLVKQYVNLPRNLELLKTVYISELPNKKLGDLITTTEQRFFAWKFIRGVNELYTLFDTSDLDVCGRLRDIDNAMRKGQIPQGKVLEELGIFLKDIVVLDGVALILALDCKQSLKLLKTFRLQLFLNRKLLLPKGFWTKCKLMQSKTFVRYMLLRSFSEVTIPVTMRLFFNLISSHLILWRSLKFSKRCLNGKRLPSLMCKAIYQRFDLTLV